MPQSLDQSCLMVCLQTKNPNLGKFWRALQWKILAYFVTIWSILRPLQIFYGHMVYFVVIWYISPRFGILYQKNLATLHSIILSLSVTQLNLNCTK
jgi:hypothetical protein